MKIINDICTILNDLNIDICSELHMMGFIIKPDNLKTNCAFYTLYRVSKKCDTIGYIRKINSGGYINVTVEINENTAAIEDAQKELEHLYKQTDAVKNRLNELHRIREHLVVKKD